jgi:hypothetical protein
MSRRTLRIVEVSAQPGRATPQCPDAGCLSRQAVLVGDGDWLVDGMLDRKQGDNVRLAENLIDWLGGAASYREIADRAGQLVNEIEILIWEVALRHLDAAYRSNWPSILSTKPRDRIRRLRLETRWERALDPGDKTSILKAEPAVGQLHPPAGMSTTQAKSPWDMSSVSGSGSHTLSSSWIPRPRWTK